jgi:Rod binding domain-containing protein
MQITNTSAAVASQLPAMLPARGNLMSALTRNELSFSPSLKGTGNAEDLREAFSQFVGETFFGQMVKSMRAMTDKPAYFHGGRAEEVFQSQLDQKLAEHLTEASADRFAEPMFERQFPHLADDTKGMDLSQLGSLRQR